MIQRLFKTFVLLISLIVIILSFLIIILLNNQDIFVAQNIFVPKKVMINKHHMKNIVKVRNHILNNNVNAIEELLKTGNCSTHIYSEGDSRTVIPILVYSAIMESEEIIKVLIKYKKHVCCDLRYCDIYNLKEEKARILKHSQPFKELALCDICDEFYP